MKDNETELKELKLMTCEETAELLRVKVDTIYSWLHYNQLPSNIYRKLGKKPTFIYSQVKEWFLNGAELKKRNGKD